MALIGTQEVEQDATNTEVVVGTSLASFLLVEKDHINMAWKKWSSEHIKKCLPYQTGHSLTSIYKALTQDSLQLWLVLLEGEVVASFTLQVEHYPMENTLCVVHLGGEKMDRWGGSLASLLNDVAKANGCSYVTTKGRKGTERMYKQWGFELESVQLKRKVT